MKTKLLSRLVLLFAAFLFCENASAQCPVDPRFKELMDKGDPVKKTNYISKNMPELLKNYHPFCLGYIIFENAYQLGQLHEAVDGMKGVIKKYPDSYKENSTEWHKAVHWAIELAEKELAANKIAEANANLNWALEGSLKAGVCPGYPVESKDSHHIHRISELIGDVAVIKGNFANAIKFYEAARSTPEIKNKIANANEKISASLKFEMVKIPAGSFKMGGSPPESQRNNKETYDDYLTRKKLLETRKYSQAEHKVTITKDFYLGKYEVTQAQWKAVMGSFVTPEVLGNIVPGCFHFAYTDENLPMSCVSWDDVQRFIGRLNARGEGKYRLPTEAEWEYAARGGTTTAYFWGNNKDDVCKYANVDVSCNDGYKEASPVGKFLPNPYGLFDMSGNVSEWCWDRLGRYTKESVIDPDDTTIDPSSYQRVIRGGSFRDYREFSPSDHSGGSHYDSYKLTGFRLVKIN